MQERFETFTVLINRISRNIRRIKNQEMAEYELRSPHISCLYYLYVSDGLTASELCELCEEDKATISRSLDFLEKNGYITREPRGERRYKSPLLLTEQGALVAEKIAAKINCVLDELSLGLSDAERASFYRSLAIISQKLEELAGNREN